MMDKKEFENEKAPQTRAIRLGKNQRRILKLMLDEGAAMQQNEIASLLNAEYDDVEYDGPRARQSLMSMVKRDDIPVKRKDFGTKGVHYAITSESKVKKMFGKKYNR